MTPERWARMKEVFGAALETPESERGAYLESTCGGDAELRREIERLLTAERSAELRSPVFGILRQPPAFPEGQMLGRYRIEEKLGEGGMGVVYRAYDKQLHRAVAIKMLSPDLASDLGRRQRLLVEARAASALNHPHICTLHDVSEHDGQAFLVMEHLEGETLAERLKTGPFPLEQTLEIGVQLADALDAAHKLGIVHRDLKPGNVMLTKTGAKLLDFGLAKLTEKTTGESSENESFGFQGLSTQEGMILGTAAYMSPEQAEGKAVDARSDIFSFGCVLYEMASGRPAFHGTSRLSTLHSIVAEEPVPLSGVAEGIPGELERIILRCLRKDRTRRCQHMEDVKTRLEELMEESKSGRPHLPYSGLARAMQSHRWKAVTAAAALAVLAAGGTWLTRKMTGRPRLPVLTQLTKDAGYSTDPALSSDGKLLAFASDRGGQGNLDIWLKQIGEGNPIRLTSNPATDRSPSFSPDGTRILFSSSRYGGGIYVVPVEGGVEMPVAGPGEFPRFSPDGNSITYTAESKVYVVSAIGGPARKAAPDFAWDRHAIWTPDGKHILLHGGRDSRDPEEADWWVVPVDSGTPVKLGFRELAQQQGLKDETSDPECWVPGTDRVLFAARSADGSNIWQVRISPATWKLMGVPERISSGTGNETSPSAAATGQMAFSVSAVKRRLWSIPFDASQLKANGDIQRLSRTAAEDRQPWLSRDGKKMVFLSDRSGNWQVWIREFDTGKEFPLTKPGPGTESVISLDGRRVLYTEPSEELPLMIVPASGGAAAKVGDDCALNDWSADGTKALCIAVHPAFPPAFSVLNLGTRRRTELLKSTDCGFIQARFSPDGRWVCAIQTRRRFATDFLRGAPLEPLRLIVVPLRNGLIPEADWITVFDGTTTNPCWSPDGNAIYFSAKHERFTCLWAQRLEGDSKRPVGPPVTVYHSHNTLGILDSRFQRQPPVPSPEERFLMDIAAQAWTRETTVSTTRIVVSRSEITGNIWMSRPAGGDRKPIVIRVFEKISSALSGPAIEFFDFEARANAPPDIAE
jgi:eukaryotic-like serine/threonine-protein kinase